MTMHKQKRLRTGRGTMKVKLYVADIPQLTPEVMVMGSDVIKIPNDQFSTFKKELQAALDTQEKNNSASSKFSLLTEVFNVMKSPRLERDDDGKRKRHPQTNQYMQKEFDIEFQRFANRITKQIFPFLKEYGKFARDHKGIDIELKPEDALELAKLMQVHFNEYTEVGEHVVDAYDHFVELESEALKAVKTPDSDEDDSEPVEEEKSTSKKQSKIS